MRIVILALAVGCLTMLPQATVAAERTCSDEQKACQMRCVSPYGFKGARLQNCIKSGCGKAFRMCLKSGTWVNNRQSTVLTGLIKK